MTPWALAGSGATASASGRGWLLLGPSQEVSKCIDLCAPELTVILNPQSYNVVGLSTSWGLLAKLPLRVVLLFKGMKLL